MEKTLNDVYGLFEKIVFKLGEHDKRLEFLTRRLNGIEDLGARLISLSADNHANLQEVSKRLDRIGYDLGELKLISDNNRSHTSFLDKKVWDNEKELFLLRGRIQQFQMYTDKEAEED